MFMLDGIDLMPMPKDVDITPTIAVLNDSRWQVRHAAIEAMKDTDSPVVEGLLIGILQSSSDPYDALCINETLTAAYFNKYDAASWKW